MTISPPANEHFKVLASGIDSLVLALDVRWTGTECFDHLNYLKEQAKEREQALPFGFVSPEVDVHLLVQPFGAKGYAWVLNGKEYALRIGNWQEPQSRPSVLIEIRSETLWRYSPVQAVERILAFIVANGGEILTTKPSRVDLCLDMLFPEEIWNVGLLDKAVTRSAHAAPFFRHRILTGIQLGKGTISARLYDKPLEIRQQSKKNWMYDIWGLESVPDGFRIIRVEFQLRRQTLKELGLDTLEGTFQTLENIWGYCSQKWLTFKEHPERHHNRRPVCSWWKVVQDNFLGIQAPCPLIRSKAIKTEKRQLSMQSFGLVTSLLTLEVEEKKAAVSDLKEQDCSRVFFENALANGKTAEELLEAVTIKSAKYHRGLSKMERDHERREQLGFPCNLPLSKPEWAKS